MKRDTVSGLALIVGSVLLLVTMAFHPTGGTIQKLASVASTARYTHALAIVSIPLTCFGFLGLCGRLKACEVLATPAIVAFGLGCIAGVCAAVLNGFAAPALAERYAGDSATHESVVAILHYNHFLNWAFANVYMVASATATLLWSLATLRTAALPRAVGGFGCLLGTLGLAVVLAGALHPTVHGFGLFVLGSSAWTIAVGVLMCRPATAAAAN